jgi:hypothetical protein
MTPVRVSTPDSIALVLSFMLINLPLIITDYYFELSLNSSFIYFYRDFYLWKITCVISNIHLVVYSLCLI